MDIRTSDILRSEATIHLTTKLDGLMKQQFPIADGVGKPYISFVAQAEDASVFVSFSPALQPQLRAPLIDLALEVASDPKHPAFCEHGSHHGTFADAIEALRFHVTEMQTEQRLGELDVRPLLDESGAPSEAGRTRRRFLVETPLFERTTARPAPFLLAKEIKRQHNNATAQKKALRQVGSLGQDSMAGAIMASFFLGMSQKEVMDIFGNKQYREKLMSERFYKYALLQPNNIDHQHMIRALQNALTIPTHGGRKPTYDPEAYQRALGIFQVHHFITQGQLQNECLRMKSVREQVFARAVFASAEEKAQQCASRDFKEPGRTNYIQAHYGSLVTTDLITAYLLFPQYQ